MITSKLNRGSRKELTSRPGAPGGPAGPRMPGEP